VPPGWVRDLDDYLNWLNRVIGDFGAWLDTKILLARDALAIDDTLLAVEVERQTVHFADGSRLELDLTVSASLDLDEYHFIYRAPDGRILWRIDKHPGHEDTCGGLCHIHLGGRGARAYAYAEVELDGILHLVSDSMSQEDIGVDD
jgi:hypothetical protein